jgi:hypothetical protein
MAIMHHRCMVIINLKVRQLGITSIKKIEE